MIALLVLRREADVLTATENGYGKLTPLEEYPCTAAAARA